MKLYINAQQTFEGIVEIYFVPDVSEIPGTYICLIIYLMFPQNKHWM